MHMSLALVSSLQTQVHNTEDCLRICLISRPVISLNASMLLTRSAGRRLRKEQLKILELTKA